MLTQEWSKRSHGGREPAVTVLDTLDELKRRAGVVRQREGTGGLLKAGLWFLAHPLYRRTRYHLYESPVATEYATTGAPLK